jgi:hypothetical protein
MQVVFLNLKPLLPSIIGRLAIIIKGADVFVGFNLDLALINNSPPRN